MNLPHLQDERSGRIATPSQEVPKRQSKFTETQIVLILKEADAGRPVDKIWRSLTYEEAISTRTKRFVTHSRDSIGTATSIIKSGRIARLTDAPDRVYVESRPV
jgi:hypothetical protein